MTIPEVPEKVADESMQALFLRAHVALHPEGKAIAGLLAGGVSASRVLSLYPYDLADWAPALSADWRRHAAERPQLPQFMLREMLWRGVAIGDGTAHSLLRGIEEEARRLPGRNSLSFRWLKEQDDLCLAMLMSPAGAELLASMSFVITQPADIDTVAGCFVTASQLIAAASSWPERAGLHEHETAWWPMVEAALAAFAPQHFSVERPPVRHDTMMFR